jgi:hypothetical protein
MTATSFVRRAAIAAATLTLATLAPAVSAFAVGGPPRVTTGGVSHARATSALLAGIVNPNGSATSYFFQYGPTIAYGHQSVPTAVGSGVAPVKVGQTVFGLLSGYHYRIVAVSAAGTSFGRDKIYSGTALRPKFAIESSKQPPTVYGGTFLLRGTLTGGALQRVTAQSSPFPYLTPFVDVGPPVLTNAAGAFTIPITNLTKSTQVRVKSNDARPVISPTVNVRVAVRVTLKVRTSSRRGLVRLYGTITPARVGATVLFQVEKAVRPRADSEEETESRFVTQSRTLSRRANRRLSRFSRVVTIRKSGRYRAYVLLRNGALVSGASSTVTLHAAAGAVRNGS